MFDGMATQYNSRMRAVLLTCLFIMTGPAEAGHYQTAQTPVVSGFGRTVSPAYVSLATSASSSAVRPGGVVSLFVDVTPNPGIHVYAPGATGYRPIGLTLRPHALKSLRYPKAETLFFEKQAVAVFEKPFRLIQDAAIARTAKPGATMTWTGTVDYQACDDKVCYLPVSVPVSWTVSVR
jgi:DsbC/DsbD-like thiol-disulfide interchange protein